MTTRSKTRKARSTAAILDPIFTLIDAHKVAFKESNRFYCKLCEAESQARKAYGRRPWSLIEWRGYRDIGGSGIDRARDEFLSLPGSDPEQVEKEYLDAKAREAAAERAGVEWDHTVGIVQLREQNERAKVAVRRAAMRIARTKPTTPVGAAAMVDHIRRDLAIGEDDWQMVALKTVAAALTQMGKEAACSRLSAPPFAAPDEKGEGSERLVPTKVKVAA